MLALYQQGQREKNWDQIHILGYKLSTVQYELMLMSVHFSFLIEMDLSGERKFVKIQIKPVPTEARKNPI